MTYTLAGINDPAQGWGIREESWAVMAALKRLGGEAWFALGDQDLATHLLRTLRLRHESLSEITKDFAHRLGVRHRIVPMSDDPIRTMVDTDEGRLAFQDYFVRRRAQPRFTGIDFEGSASARPAAALLAALDDPALKAIIICPSNPLLSIRPILSLSGIEQRLRRHRAPVLAISPFIGGKAVKGPAAKILQELALPVTPAGVLQCYAGLLDALVIDHADIAPGVFENADVWFASHAAGAACRLRRAGDDELVTANPDAQPQALCNTADATASRSHAMYQAGAGGEMPRSRRIAVLVTDTLMRDAADQMRLADEVLAFVRLLQDATR